MSKKPDISIGKRTITGNIIRAGGFDDSIFKTFTKKKKNRQKNKAARKARKITPK